MFSSVSMATQGALVIFLWMGCAQVDLASAQSDSNFKCLVCTSDKNVKKLYDPKCLSPTSALLSSANSNAKAWKCVDYNTKFNTALAPRGLDVGANVTINKCEANDFSVCRSFYYSSDYKYNKVENNGVEEAMTGKNELVFRFCGCVKDGTKEGLLKGAKTQCKDINKGGIRTRRCVCDPKKAPPNQVCNSAPPTNTQINLVFKALWANAGLTLTFGALFLGSTWVFDGVAPA